MNPQHRPFPHLGRLILIPALLLLAGCYGFEDERGATERIRDQGVISVGTAGNPPWESRERYGEALDPSREPQDDWAAGVGIKSEF